MPRSKATKVVETLAAERCPCGHLSQRHRKPTDDWIEGITQIMGECRDCECRGLLQMDEEPALVTPDNDLGEVA